MNQLRLAWSCNSLELSSNGTRKKPAKCGLSSTPSGKSHSLLKKFERLQRERPHAAAVIERLVDQTLAEFKIG